MELRCVRVDPRWLPGTCLNTIAQALSPRNTTLDSHRAADYGTGMSSEHVHTGRSESKRPTDHRKDTARLPTCESSSASGRLSLMITSLHMHIESTGPSARESGLWGHKCNWRGTRAPVSFNSNLLIGSIVCLRSKQFETDYRCKLCRLQGNCVILRKMYDN